MPLGEGNKRERMRYWHRMLYNGLHHCHGTIIRDPWRYGRVVTVVNPHLSICYGLNSMLSMGARTQVLMCLLPLLVACTTV